VHKDEEVKTGSDVGAGTARFFISALRFCAEAVCRMQRTDPAWSIRARLLSLRSEKEPPKGTTPDKCRNYQSGGRNAQFLPYKSCIMEVIGVS